MLLKEGINVINTDLKKEIKFIAVTAIILDIVLIIVAMRFIPIINVLTGVFFGTILLIADMFFLSLSIQNIVADAEVKKNKKNASVKMFFLYVLRLIFIASGLLAAFKLPFISVICTAFPLFYPKIIYFIKAIFSKKGG